MRVPTSYMRRILLGQSTFILSHSEFKRALLTGQLALTSFVIALFYLIYDLSLGVYTAYPFEGSCALAALASFILNRRRLFRLSKIILGVAVNFTIFFFSASEPAATGTYSLYIPACLGALAAFGYEERKLAILFVSLSSFLCLLSFAADWQIVPSMRVDSHYVQINLIANIIISFSTSVIIIYFLLNVNYRSEKILIENEKKLTSKNEELVKVNSELDRFVYSSSHDLRAPLSSMLGLIQLTEYTNEPQELRKYISLIKDRVNHLDKFVKDIADYSRNTRVDIVRSVIDVRKMVYEVLESLRFYPNSDHIKVEVFIDNDFTIVSDETRLKIILANVVSNSFKYFDPTKAESKITLRATEQEEWLILDIQDNGIGISEELQPKIFDMFFQAHEKSFGSGLGLYIVKETVQKLNGNIQLKSNVEVGTQFMISIPITKAV